MHADTHSPRGVDLDLHLLAIAVIERAISDAQGRCRNQDARNDALRFLRSDESAFIRDVWASLAGFDGEALRRAAERDDAPLFTTRRHRSHPTYNRHRDQGEHHDGDRSRNRRRVSDDDFS